MKPVIVGLCGAHGTGKSSILKAVEAAGYPVDSTQLSRTAQRMLGWSSLSVAQDSEENMWDLQDAILASMYDRDQRIIASGVITLVDRTPADVWGYTALWASRIENVNKERLAHYKRQCRTLAADYKRQIIVPIREEIPFVAEANRADEQSRLFHATEVEKFVIDGGLDYAIIQTLNIDYRAIEVIERMKTCGGCA